MGSGSIDRDVKSRHIPEIPDDHFDALNDIRKEHKETWAETFERFYNYQDWVQHLFELPKESSAIDKLNAVTVTSLLPMWLENLRQNVIGDTIVPDVGAIENSVKPGTPGLVIGAGPSLIEKNHLGMLRDSVFYQERKGTIISTAHSLKSCLDAGVVPDYMTMVDASPKMMGFIDNEIVDEHSKDITGIFSMETDPAVLKRWTGEKRFFSTVIPHMTIPNVHTVLSCLFPNIVELDCLSNCGSFSWNLARYTGCNPIALIGMDLSFKPDFPLKDTPYYEAYQPSYESEQDMLDACYRFHTHSVYGTNSYTDYAYGTFWETLQFAIKMYKQRDGIETQNCTEGGIIDDEEVVESVWFKDWLMQWE